MKLGLAHPDLAPLGIATLAVIALIALTLWRRARASAAFAGTGSRLVSVQPAVLGAKAILLALACVAITVALVGPEVGEAARRGGTAAIDTVIALDVSQSMAVRDVEPDRLHAAERAIEALGSDLAGGRVGLVLFAGTSVLRYPLTADTHVLGPALDTSGRGFKIAPGSALRAALNGAAAQFPTDKANEPRGKAIVVISDGEDPAPELPPLGALTQRNIRIFTLGVGTRDGGPVPLYDPKGRFQQMLVNANGTQITSRLDEDRLRAIAEQGGGRYVHYSGTESVRELADAVRSLETGVTFTESGVTAENRYQIFLAVAVVALLVSWLLDERRGMPTPRVGRTKPVRRRRLLAILSAGLFLLGACASADPLAEQVDAANDVFKRDPAAALTRYRELALARPASPEIAVNHANTLATLGQYERALIEYGRALDNAKGKTRSVAFYGRGNTLFRLGRLAEARGSYVEALRLDPTDRDAKFNIEVIDRIAQQMQQPAPNPGQQGQASAPPGQSQPPGQQQQPAPSGASGPTTPGGSPPPNPGTPASGSPPPSVQGVLTDFRRNLTVDEALRLLDALRGEQRGVEGLIEGTGVRRGGNFDTPY